jgi:hypothetical protein
MSKQQIPGVLKRGQKSRDSNGNRTVKKSMSHGALRCKRRPNSKRCLNGSMK